MNPSIPYEAYFNLSQNYQNLIKKYQQEKLQAKAYEEQIAGMTSSFQAQSAQQQQMYQQQLGASQRQLELAQQQALQSQTGQAADQQQAYVQGAPGSMKIIRPGASSRFSRRELQINSVNI